MKNNVKKGLIPYLAFFLVVMLVLGFLNGTGYKTNEITYEQFLNYAKSEDEANKIKYIDITSNSSAGIYTITGKLNSYGEKETFTFSIANSDAVVGNIYELANEYNFSIKASRDPGSSTVLYFVVNILPFLIFGVVIFVFLSKQMGSANKSMDFGRSRARLSDGGNKVTFKDVAGLEEEKEEVQELIDFLKEPKKFQKMGARIPKGVLLVGPPGTGKTLLARAVAGEANVPFYFISGSDFVELFVGIGASRVRDMFRQAKHNAPCLIFIDEIDAVGRQRGAGLGGGHDEREQTLNQLLTEMDGFGANEGIIILAATNRPDVLDPALLRPGRFDRQITIPAPDFNGRVEILKLHSKDKKFSDNVNLKDIAGDTAGFTGAELANVLNESAIIATRNNHDAIEKSDIEYAIKKITVGLEKHNRVVSQKDKKLTAYHEAGHAVVSKFLETQKDVKEISIIPRGLAGGYTMYKTTEDKFYVSKTELEEKMIALMGGRAAEKLALDDISTGASNDLEVATGIARDMITTYGMSETLGPISLKVDSPEELQLFGENVIDEVGVQVKSLIDTAYVSAQKILLAHMDILKIVAETLLEKEIISGEEFDRIIEEQK